MDLLPQSFNQKLFLAIHVSIYIIIVFSPLFVNDKIKNNYGYLISSFLYGTILSWVILGGCPFNKIQNSSKHGTVVTFLNNMGFDAVPYEETISFISTYATFAAIFYYSPSRIFTFFTILLLLSYSVKKYFYNAFVMMDVVNKLS